jgi:hypothetical protein
LLKGLDEMLNYRVTADVTDKLCAHLCQPISKIAVKPGTGTSGFSSLTKVMNDLMCCETKMRHALRSYFTTLAEISDT